MRNVLQTAGVKVSFLFRCSKKEDILLYVREKGCRCWTAAFKTCHHWAWKTELLKRKERMNPDRRWEVLGGRFPFFSRQLCHLQELRAQRATDEPSASEGNGQRDKVSLRTCEAALLCHLNQDYIQSSFTGYSNAQWIQLRFRAKIFTKDAAASISLTSRQIKEKKELRFFWILN